MNLVEMHDIELKFGDRLLFGSEDVSIAKPGIYPLIGLNGSGKSTLLRMLAGIIEPSAGSFATTGTILYQPQKPAVFRMEVLQNALIGTEAGDKETALKILSDVGLAGFESMPAKTLSGGEQQRLHLCRSILTAGDIMLLDEPFSAIDHKSAEGLAKYLQNICVRTGAIMLIAMHNLHLAHQVSEHCLLIKNYRLLFCSTTEGREYLLGEYDHAEQK